MIARNGDPVLSMDGETILAYWTASFAFKEDANSYTWTWFSPKDSSELIAGPKMRMNHDGNMVHANRITIALEYARGPIQVWRVVQCAGGEEIEAFRFVDFFAEVKTGSDAELSAAIYLVLKHKRITDLLDRRQIESLQSLAHYLEQINERL